MTVLSSRVHLALRLGFIFFDIRAWKRMLPTKGTFNWWYRQHGQIYSTDAMAAQLKTDLAKYGSKIKYYYGYDIKSIGWRSPAHITEVRLCSIDRNQTSGIVQWGSLTDTVAGTVFIDASDSGRLTRLSNFGGTVGRYDFPAKYLDSDEWWLNSLLVFNVDGRAHNRDKGTSVFPADMRSDYRTVDDAWVAARNMINTAEFQTAIREFPGFQSSTIVKDSRGLPVVGEVLYLRETIHSALSASSRANGTENSNYELRSEDCNLAGATQTSGKDSRNYAKRIGLNFYWSDINAYKFEDLKDANGNYIWFNRVPNKKYTGEFKQMVVETMRKEGMSCWEADRKFGLPQRRTQTWERIYLEKGPEGLYIERRGRGTKAGHKPALEKK